MTELRERLSTIVLLMMENRSFDHMLGHLSLEGLVPEVDGLRAPLSQYQNLHEGDIYSPFRMRDRLLDADLPHESDEVATQLGWSAATKRYTMNGFVEAYAKARGMLDVAPFPDPMGYFPSTELPVTSALARSYLTCDRWFSPLPSSTQPNRCMAWCGESKTQRTGAQLLSNDGTLLDWMEAAGVDWRVYHDGLSFFALFPAAWRHLFSDRFRDFERLLHDLSTDPVAAPGRPQVIIVEPSYQSGPHVGPDRPNDNHAPLAVGWGEEFLRRTYEAVRAHPGRWERTLMVVTYDEHGGFFDHVPPPGIPYTTGGDEPRTFTSTGPRVPAILVSPLVGRSAVSHLQLDHTSVLQFLAEVFTPGTPYSARVDGRRKQGISSFSSLLGEEARDDTPPPPTQPIAVTTVLGKTLAEPPASEMQAAFELAANELMKREPERTTAKYPELHHWKVAVETARGQRG